MKINLSQNKFNDYVTIRRYYDSCVTVEQIEKCNLIRRRFSKKFYGFLNKNTNNCICVQCLVNAEFEIRRKIMNKCDYEQWEKERKLAADANAIRDYGHEY